MAWPIESDYFEAIQNPRFCFNDPDLQAGSPELTPLGLPRPITGAFASVYQLKCPSGRWAVRCFLRDFSDHQKRYDAISQHLSRIGLPFTVGFQFHREGIKIKGKWYPILKMEWIDGDPINTYVERNAINPVAIQQLARQWVDMLSALRTNLIAHGDLQHGNIIVSQSRLRLIDYDGMFVPGLRGMTSHEEGHRNYQHPARTSNHFNENLDNFSAWVVFLSLSALSVEPRLWKLLNGGDECLIFRREDFLKPHQSKAFQLFERNAKPEIQALAAHLKLMLRLPFDQVPPLDGSQIRVEPASSSSTSAGNRKPEWLDGHVVFKPEEDDPLELPKEVSQPVQATSANWIIDHLLDEQPLPPAYLGQRFVRERMIGAAAALICISFALAMIFGSLAAIVAGLGGSAATLTLFTLYLRERYLRSPLPHEKNRLRSAIGELHRSIKQSQTVQYAIVAEAQKLMRPLIDLDARYRNLPVELQQRQQRVHDEAAKALSGLQQQQVELDVKENQELKAVEAKVARDVSGLNRQRYAIDNSEQVALSELGATARNLHVRYRLQRATLAEASLSGIGQKLKSRLIAHGIYCAADIDNRIYHISGIGTQKAATLESWRRYIEIDALNTAPQPTGVDVDRIKYQHQNQRQQIVNQIAQLKHVESRERQRVLDNFTRYRAQFADQEVATRRQLDHDLDTVRQDYENRRQEVSVAFRKLKPTVDNQQKQIEDRLSQIQRTLFEKQFEVAKLNRDAQRYRHVNFRSYVAHLIGFKSAA